MLQPDYDIGDIFFNEDQTLVGIIIKKDWVGIDSFNRKIDKEIEVWKYTISFSGKKKVSLIKEDIRPPCVKVLTGFQLGAKLLSGGWSVQRRQTCT